MPLAPLPWEQPGYPALEGLYETAKLFLTKPTEAFQRMSISGDLGRPLGYAVILGWVGIIAGQAYNIALRGTMRNMLAPFSHGEDLAFGLGFNIAIMVVAPILILLGVFIGSAILHLFLMLVGGNNNGFVTTTRVVCYATTIQIFQIVPLCGGLIGAAWGVVLEIIGIAAAHRTTQGKAAAAVLLPMVLCCVCLAILAVAFGAAILAALGKLR
ncbi:MAG: YIP1 family protein [Acidobacteriota bacterium]